MADTITGTSYTNDNIKNLQAQIDKANAALGQFNTSAATDESLRQQATNQYTPIYNAQVQEQESLKNSAQNTLNSTLGALDRQYARDAEALGRNYDKQRVAANNSMLARGFNNSSLAVAMLNHVETERGRALQNLQLERAAGEASARDAYNSAISAADKAIGRLGSDLQMNIDNRYQALKDADYDRVFQATQAQNALTQYTNELMMQIEQLRQQGYNQYLQQQQFEAQLALQREKEAEAKRQYDEQMALKREQWEYEKSLNEGRGGSGGSSGGGSNPGGGAPQPTVPPNDPGSLDDLYDSDKPVAGGPLIEMMYDRTGQRDLQIRDAAQALLEKYGQHLEVKNDKGTAVVPNNLEEARAMANAAKAKATSHSKASSAKNTTSKNSTSSASGTLSAVADALKKALKK